MKSNVNMLSGPLFKNIVLYTIPIILTGILQLLFNAADIIVVGQFCGSISVAAVGNTGSITSLIVNVFIGLSMGASVAVAQAIGAHDDDAVHKTVHTAIAVSIVAGIILTIVGVVFSETFLRLMNTPESVLPLSAIYMKIYFGGIIFIMVYNFASAILRAAGDTKSPLIFLTISGVLNVVLNFIFVRFLNLNVAGVALATTISQAVSAILVVLALRKREDAVSFSFSSLAFHKSPLIKIIRIGLPAGIQNSLFSISNVIIQTSINSFGDVVMSGNAAAGNIEGFEYIAMNSFYQTALNFTGQNVGAKQYNRVKKILLLCLGCVIVTAAILSTIIYLLATPLLSIYITDSAEAVSWGVTRIAYICLPYFLCGIMEVSTGALRGMGVSVAPMLTSIIGICAVRVLWVYTIFQIPQFHTPQCLYSSYIVSWTVTFIVQIIMFAFVYKRRRLNP